MSIEISNEDFAKLLREKAEAGDPEFQTQVGKCYLWNEGGIEENDDEAIKWFKLAAKQGYVEAQYLLGETFYMGYGHETDYKKAVEWYRQSSEQGFALATYMLALCYKHGQGVEQNNDKSIELYTLSAEQGYWGASTDLGDIYRDGKIVGKDLSKAKKYYEKAMSDADFYYEPADDDEKEEIQEEIDEINAELEMVEEKAKAAREAKRTEVFISYSHSDREYIDNLRPHLEMLKKTTNIKWWDDTQIKSGEQWRKEINKALLKTKIAVLMVSANFFASDFVWNEEYPQILKAAEDSGATILWLPVSHCYYEDTEIAGYQAVTDPKNPLARCTPAEQDEAYTNLVKRIKELFRIQPV